MVLRIRLARFGKRHAPFYNIVLAHARTARNSKPIEVLGTYDPIPKQIGYDDTRPVKDIQLDIPRAKYWLGIGAQPSDTAYRLLAMAGLLPPKYRVGQRAGAPQRIALDDVDAGVVVEGVGKTATRVQAVEEVEEKMEVRGTGDADPKVKSGNV